MTKIYGVLNPGQGNEIEVELGNYGTMDCTHMTFTTYRVKDGTAVVCVAGADAKTGTNSSSGYIPANSEGSQVYPTNTGPVTIQAVDIDPAGQRYKFPNFPEWHVTGSEKAYWGQVQLVLSSGYQSAIYSAPARSLINSDGWVSMLGTDQFVNDVSAASLVWWYSSTGQSNSGT